MDSLSAQTHLSRAQIYTYPHILNVDLCVPRELDYTYPHILSVDLYVPRELDHTYPHILSVDLYVPRKLDYTYPHTSLELNYTYLENWTTLIHTHP